MDIAGASGTDHYARIHSCHAPVRYAQAVRCTVARNILGPWKTAYGGLAGCLDISDSLCFTKTQMGLKKDCCFAFKCIVICNFVLNFHVTTTNALYET